MNVQGIKNLVDKSEILKAEIVLKTLLSELFLDLKIDKVQIQKSQLSLNSVNGFVKVQNKKELFFKFHTEENEILEEYYRAELLEKYGFPIIKPLYVSKIPGKQILIYEKVETKRCFDVLNEKKKILNEKKFLEEQERMDEKALNVALKTLKIVSAEEYDKSKLLQLFYRRLKLKDGIPRVDSFYKNKEVVLPNNKKINFEVLKKYKWIINGRKYESSLKDLIVSATEILDPFRFKKVPVCVGHGDDHYGNIFCFEKNNGYKFKYFDPAFAEDIQHVLLTQVKATFHNIFAHPFWLYNPELLEKDLKIKFDLDDKNKVIKINHNWDLQENDFRMQLFKLKVEKFWKPLISELKKRDLLEDDWLVFIKRALFCCPFLVLNLINLDKEKGAVSYTPKTSLLALSKAVEMGSFSPSSCHSCENRNLDALEEYFLNF